VVPALTSALLLWFAFPPAGRGYLAWVALVPLFLLVRSERSRRSIYFGAWVGGLAFWLLAVYWVWETDSSAWLAWVVLAAFLSLWWPAFLLLVRPAVRVLRLPLMIAAPIVWVALEYARAHILTGLPWYYLAHSQYRYIPLIQIADLTGAWGLSYLVAMANAWGVDLLTYPLARGGRVSRAQLARALVMAGALLATVGYGLARVATAPSREGPRVALLQSNFEQRLKNSLDSETIIGTYQRLADRALEAGGRPDLVVWPETSYPRGYPVIGSEVDDRILDKLAKMIHPRGTADFWRREKVATVNAEVRHWIDLHGIPMLVGTVVYDFQPGGYSRYNAALFFPPGGGPVQTYYKIHLVPFGEYVPLIDAFPWLTRLTPYHGESVPSLAFGTRPVGFDWKGWRFATAICFEDTVPHVVRRFFTEMPDGRRPDVLLNISNDGWFHGSAELDMHLAISVFRAVEHRVPLARAVNTGISALIDGNGRILEALPKLQQGVLVHSVPLDGRSTRYTAWGDWFALGCLAVTIGLVVVGGVRRVGRPGETVAISPGLPKGP
jgi:apolipoprotein N-acyltransferase